MTKLHNAAPKETAKDAVELFELIHNSNSDQSLGKDAPELGEYDHGN